MNSTVMLGDGDAHVKVAARHRRAIALWRVEDRGIDSPLIRGAPHGPDPWVHHCRAVHRPARSAHRPRQTPRLLAIITIALCGVICGADSWVEIERFGRAKRVWLERFLPLPHGIPSHDTFGRVFAALDPTAFETAFLGWVQVLVTTTDAAHSQTSVGNIALPGGSSPSST